MQLTRNDIREILLNRPNLKLVTAAQEYTKKLMVHHTGVGLDEYLERIINAEGDKQIAARKKYAKSNKDLFAKLHRPIDKVYSARGGSISYNTSEQIGQSVSAMLSNVEYGYTLRKWMEVFYRKALHYDPMGIVLMEVSNNEVYPVYRSALDVYDYQLNGRDLDYVILTTDIKTDSGKKVYRVIDDSNDMLIEWDGANYTKYQNTKYPNYWGYVPARIISNIYDPVRGFYISPDDDCIEIADQYLREGSVLNVHKNLFMFPQRWSYAGMCTECSGTGMKGGEDCKACNGSKQKAITDPSETVVIPFPEDKEQPIITPNIMGYSTPDKVGVELMISSLTDLFNSMYYVTWGIENMQKADGKADDKTATEILYNEQPKIERLHYYSDAAEEMEKYITDQAGMFMYPESFTGADVHYGRRYIMESPDAIWKKYQEARKEGAPQSDLDAMLEDYYMSKYKGDSNELAKVLKLMKIEPLVHETISSVKNLLGEQSIEYRMKVVFRDWANEKPPMQIIRGQLKALREDLRTYAESNIEIQEESNINDNAG